MLKNVEFDFKRTRLIGNRALVSSLGVTKFIDCY